MPKAPIDALRRAILAKDVAAVSAHLDEDVVFRSPAVHTPYEGRAATMQVLRAAMVVLTEFTYVDQFVDGRGGVLRFHAIVHDLEVDGIDMVTFDDRGRVTQFTVMVRPLSALQAVTAAMGAELQHQTTD